MKLIRISKEDWVNIEKIYSIKLKDDEIWIMTDTCHVIPKGSGYYELTLKALKISK